MRVLLYLFFCRSLMMLRLSMTPWPASGSAPPLSPTPWHLTPARPRLPSRGGAWCLGCTLVRAPQVVRVTGGHWPPPGGWASGQVCAGLCDICDLEVVKVNRCKWESSSEFDLTAAQSLLLELVRDGVSVKQDEDLFFYVGLVKPDAKHSKGRH